MGTQVLYADDLPKISSEYIEPYAQRFMMMVLEGIAYGFITPEQGKVELNVVESFICCFSGMHAQIAVSNEYRRIKRMDNTTLLKIAKETFNL